MNEGTTGRSNGFTTCLLARIDGDGAVTIANAGHLAPYLNGEELLVTNGLPLGLTSETEYTETQFHLPDAGQLTFITDGVVEARSEKGDLYGFERTASVAALSAKNIADAAASFGQDDDITVVTLKRLGKKASGRTQTFTFPLAQSTA